MGAAVKSGTIDIVTSGRSRPHLRGEVSLPRLALERGRQMVRLYENWPTAIGDRLGLLRRPRHVIYRVRLGGEIVELVARANGCDVRTIGEIWIGGLYDRLVDRSLPWSRQPVVVDIGANCGYFSIYMAKRYPGAQLICFEPETENRSLARANFALNRVRAQLNSEAVVVNGRSTVTLNLSHDPRLHTIVSFEQAKQHGIDSERYSGRTVSVPAVNVNEAIGRITATTHVDLLKVDVEGVDLELVGAIDEQLLSRINGIVAETEARDTNQVALKLRSAGFSVSEDAGLLFAFRTPQPGVRPAQGVSFLG